MNNYQIFCESVSQLVDKNKYEAIMDIFHSCFEGVNGRISLTEKLPANYKDDDYISLTEELTPEQMKKLGIEKQVSIFDNQLLAGTKQAEAREAAQKKYAAQKYRR